MLVNEIINAKDLPVMEFDGIIVGGGGAGMRASLQLAEVNILFNKLWKKEDHSLKFIPSLEITNATI